MLARWSVAVLSLSLTAPAFLLQEPYFLKVHRAERAEKLSLRESLQAESLKAAFRQDSAMLSCATHVCPAGAVHDCIVLHHDAEAGVLPR